MATAPRRSQQEQLEIDRNDRRQFLIVAIVFTVVIGIITLLYVATSELTSPPSPESGAAQQVARPAFDVPDGGQKPASASERGGAQQLALMAGLGVVLVGGSAYVVHTSRRARAQMAERAT